MFQSYLKFISYIFVLAFSFACSTNIQPIQEENTALYPYFYLDPLSPQKLNNNDTLHCTTLKKGEYLEIISPIIYLGVGKDSYASGNYAVEIVKTNYLDNPSCGFTQFCSAEHGCHIFSPSTQKEETLSIIEKPAFGLPYFKTAYRVIPQDTHTDTIYTSTLRIKKNQKTLQQIHLFFHHKH